VHKFIYRLVHRHWLPSRYRTRIHAIIITIGIIVIIAAPIVIIVIGIWSSDIGGRTTRIAYTPCARDLLVSDVHA